MIEILKESSGNVVGFDLGGKLHNDDYKEFIPAVEQVIEREGRVRILAHFHDFRGWDLHAMLDDLVFGSKHYGDIERIALVGGQKWEEWMATACRPFTRAEVRCFDAGEVGQAWVWLREAA